jgi:hypothetical protein
MNIKGLFLVLIIVLGILAFIWYLDHIWIGWKGIWEGVNRIAAAGSSAPTELTLALFEPLPKNANNISIYVSGTAPVTATGLSLPSPTYVNGHPEYIFEITASNSITVDSVTGMSYSLNGKTINVTGLGGVPLPIQPIPSTNVVIP